MLDLKSILLTLVFVLTLSKQQNSVAKENGSRPQRCMLHTASTTCDHYYLIAELRFHGFIDKHSLSTTCSQMQDALHCVDKLLISCNTIVRTPYEMQRNVIDMICNNRTQEYLKSAECFSRPGLQQRINGRCLTKGSDEKRLKTDPCRLAFDIGFCSAREVRSTGRCTEEDARFMAILMLNFFYKLCDDWTEDHHTSPKIGQTTAPTGQGPAYVVVEQAKQSPEIDKPLTGGGSSMADKPIIKADPSESTPAPKDKNGALFGGHHSSFNPFLLLLLCTGYFFLNFFSS